MPQKGGWGGGGASEPIASWVAEFGPSDEWIRLLSGGPVVVGALTTLTGLAIASVLFFFFKSRWLRSVSSSSDTSIAELDKITVAKIFKSFENEIKTFFDVDNVDQFVNLFDEGTHGLLIVR